MEVFQPLTFNAVKDFSCGNLGSSGRLVIELLHDGYRDSGHN
jgi:hypothetical protein